MSPLDAPLPSDLDAAHQEIRQLRQVVAGLQQQLEQLFRQRYGSTSERRDPRQLGLFDEPPSPPPPPPPAPAPPRRGHGRQTLPANLPRHEVIHDVPDDDKPCPDCGQLRSQIGEETREQLEYVPASLRVLVHRRFKYACRSCQGHVATAARLPEPIEKGLPGHGLLAQVIVSKYVDHLPLYRQESIFTRQGVKLSRSTTCDWMATSASLLEPIAQALATRVLQSQVIQTDDTPVKVQDHGGRGTKTGRLWVYRGDRQHPFVVFDYTPNRSRDGPEAFLKTYVSGYLQSDAYSGYDRLHARGLVAVGCWAHARRKFHEARSSDAARAEEALDWIGRLYQVERAAQTKIALREEALGGPLSPAARWAWQDRVLRSYRDRQARPLIEGFAAWLETQSRQVLPKSPLGKAISYTRSNWSTLLRYLEVPWLSIDNNASERALRPIAVGRKNWLHLGSDAGGRTAAILLSLTQSALAFHLDPWRYLQDLLSRISTHPSRRLAELLPDQWTPIDPR